MLGYYKTILEKEKLTVLTELKQLSGDRYAYILRKQEIGSAVTFDVLQAKNAFLSDSATFLLQELNLEKFPC